MNMWVTAQEYAEVLGITARAARIRLHKEGIEGQQRIGRGGGYEYHISNFPDDVQAPLLLKRVDKAVVAQPAAQVDYDRDALWANYERKTTKQKDKAAWMLGILNKVMALVDKDIPLKKALTFVAQEEGMSAATIKNWYFGVGKKEGVRGYDRSDWLAVLVPGNSGSKEFAECSPEAWEMFKADYLRLEAPSRQAVYERVKRAGKANGWAVPSIDSFRRRLEAEVSLPVRVMMREGEHALMRLYPSQTRDVSGMHAMEHINGDGYMHNVWIAVPGQEKPVRMKTWFWQDVYSRRIIGWRTDFTENSDQIRLSFGDVVEKFGIPYHVTIDNTRAAANKWMTGGVANRYRFKVKEDDPVGLFPMLGVEVHWTSVINGHGHGQAKPIERAFGVGGLGEYVDKHPRFAGAWTGDNPMNKPENYGSEAVPLDEFLKVLNQEILAWNAREKRNTQQCGGYKSFNQVFEESFSQAPIRKATAEQRRLWMLTAESIRVGKDASITLEAGSATGVGKNRYHCSELFDYIGQKLVVRFDPMELHKTVSVYTLEGRFIGQAACIQAVGFRDTVAAREHARARKAMMKNAKEQASHQVRMTALEVAQQLPLEEEPEKPESEVVQMVFAQGNTARVVNQVQEIETDTVIEEEQTHQLFSNAVRQLRDAKRAEEI